MPKTNGISPKVAAQLVAGAITYVLAHFSIKLDPDLAATVAAAIGALFGVLVGPGDVTHPPTADETAQAAAPQTVTAAAGPPPSPAPVMPAPTPLPPTAL